MAEIASCQEIFVEVNHYSRMSSHYKDSVSWTFKTSTYFWLRWVFADRHGLSPIVVRGGSSPVAVCRLLTAAAPLGEHRLWARASVVVVLRLSSCDTGLVAPRHVESSQTRDRTHGSCTGRQNPNHWTPRGVPKHLRQYLPFHIIL